MTTLLLCAGAVVMVSMLAMWLLSLQQHNFSYVDLGWALNFLCLALLYGLLGTGDPVRRMLICGMYAVWSARLAWHLGTRIIGQPEEGRYLQLRAEWSVRGKLNFRFLVFFQFQALLNLLLSLPMLLTVISTAAGMQPLEFIGCGFWLLGFSGESLADAQLRHFKRDPAHRGKVCMVGLWGWSRHPNYFFEWIIWVGYALFALASPYGWLCLVLPLLMLHFLINVTGIKPTEAQALRSRGEAYRHYQRTVSAFIPLPRKQERP